MRFVGTIESKGLLVFVASILWLLLVCSCSENPNVQQGSASEKMVQCSIEVDAPYPVLASGQEYSLWPGDDGDLKLGAGSKMGDSDRYVLREDGVLEDHLTGLMWMFNAPYWAEVMQDDSYLKHQLRLIDILEVDRYIAEINDGVLSDNNLGYSDWRWPSVQEAISLFRFWGMSRRGPKLNVPSDFVRKIGGAARRSFTTSTPFPQSANQMYKISFSGWKEIGPSGSNAVMITPVRTIPQAEVRDESLLVRVPAVGPRKMDAMADKQWPVPRFEICEVDTQSSADDFVIDHLTGLMWARDAGGAGDLSWFEAVEYCQQLELGGYTDWRMPNIMEQLSVLCLGFASPALCNTDGDGVWSDGDPFLSVEASNYWSSTGYEMNHEKVYCVNLGNGGLVPEWVGRSPLNERITKLLTGKRCLRKVWPVRGGLQQKEEVSCDP